jgi:peptidoglycan/xylan/chitin deacetylase (PgdA/CDA1 family)
MSMRRLAACARAASTGVLSAGEWLPQVRRLPAAGAADAVALSFDDGPTPQTTPGLIALLRRHGATATFFLTGERAERSPALVAALVAEGHDVFAHGWRHVPYADEPVAVLHDDMTRAEAVLRRFRPTPEPYLVRLPYVSGRRSVRMHRAIRAWSASAQLAFWRYGFEDHRLAEECSTVDQVRRRCDAASAPVLAAADLPGAVLLLHEMPYGVAAPLSAEVTPALTECVLRGLARRGLRATRMAPAPSQPWPARFVLGW